MNSLILLVYVLIIKLIHCNTDVEVEVIPALLIHEEHQYLYPNDPRLQNVQGVNNKPKVNAPNQPHQTNIRNQNRVPSNPPRNDVRPFNARPPSSQQTNIRNQNRVPSRNNVQPLNARPPSSGLQPPPPAVQRPPPRMNKRVQNLVPSGNRIQQSRPTTPKSAFHPIDLRKPVGLKPPLPSQTVNRGPNYNVNRRKNKNIRNGQINPGIKNSLKPIIVQPLQNVDPINMLPPSNNEYLPLNKPSPQVSNLPIQQNQYLPSRQTQNQNRNRINLGNVASSGQSQYLPNGQNQNNEKGQNQYLPNSSSQNKNQPLNSLNNALSEQNQYRPVQNSNRNRINAINSQLEQNQPLSYSNSKRPVQNIPNEERRYLPKKQEKPEEAIGVTALRNALVTVEYEIEANKKTNGPSTYKTYDVNSRITEVPPTRSGRLNRRRGDTRPPEYDYDGVTRPLRRQESNVARVKFRQSNGVNRKNPPRIISSESFQMQNYPRY